MGSCEGIVLRASAADTRDGRIWSEVDLEEVRPRNLAGKANIGNCDLVALAISAGFFFGRKVLFQRAQRGLVPMLRPFHDTGFIDLEFMREIFAHAWHDQRMRIAGHDL